MKTRKGEPVIVVPEEQQQIVELERQLAKRDRRIGELEAEVERIKKVKNCYYECVSKAEADQLARRCDDAERRAEEGEGERAEELRATIRALEQSVDKLLRERQQAEASRNNWREIAREWEGHATRWLRQSDEWEREANRLRGELEKLEAEE